MFEPIGMNADLLPGEEILLDLPLAHLEELQIVTWNGGIEIWLPYPADMVVFDKEGNELFQL